MDTNNRPRPESNLPARVIPASGRLPAQMSTAGNPGGGVAPASIRPSTLLRGLIRHWWHILGLSLIVSGPLVYAIYVFITPKFEAESTLRIEPTKTNLYLSGPSVNDNKFIDSYIQTQLA